MSELLVNLAQAAAASYSEGEGILTAEYLDTCRGLLPIIGEQEARMPPPKHYHRGTSPGVQSFLLPHNP